MASRSKGGVPGAFDPPSRLLESTKGGAVIDAEKRQSLRERADALVRQADELRRLADQLYPLSEDEETDRMIQEDDDALWALLCRVHRTVLHNPEISADMVADAMGLPNDYPSPGSNYFTMQLLTRLEQIGLVTCYRGRKPFEWTANPMERPRPALVLVK